MSTSRKTDRRQFIQLLGTGTLMAGVYWLPSRPGDAASGAEPVELPGAFVLVSPDNEITIRVNRPEMGQGTLTSLPMLIAEELEVEWTQVRVELAPVRPPFSDPGFYGVEWSSSIRDMHAPLSRLGAGLRELLVAAAARRWGLAEGDCEARAGRVHSRIDARVATYAELAPHLAGATLNEKVALKEPARRRLLGTRVANVITPDVVSGRSRYGIDVSVRSAKTAVLSRPPNRDAVLEGLDEAAARAVAGVVAIEKVPQGVAVVARDFWSATRGMAALKVRWNSGRRNGTDSASISAALRAALDQPPTFVPLDHPLAGAHAAAGRRMEAIYEVPYQAHGAIEPTSAVADVRADSCEVWMANQNVSHIARSVGKALGRPPGAITVHPELMGGSFGRKYEPDPAIEAAELSRRLGYPVRVIWTREDETRNGPHRPAQMARLSATLGDDGLPRFIDVQYAGPSYWIRTPEELERLRTRRKGFDGSTLEGMVPFPYPVPFQRVRQRWEDFGIRVGSWRSTAHSFNLFFTESLADELAHAAKEDPLAYRLRWLEKGQPFPADRIPSEAFNPEFSAERMRRVALQAANLAGWQTGEGMGIALSFGYEAYLAMVARVRMEAKRAVVSKLWVVADVGTLINRSLAEQQIEGGAIFGLTAALRSGLTVRNGAVQQSNFHDFPILRLNEVPPITVQFVDSDAKPGGLGEAGVPLAAPAVANAVFAATGKRLRRLPLEV